MSTSLENVYVFPQQPPISGLWGAAPFSITAAIQPSTRKRNIVQYGSDSIGPGTIRQGLDGSLEILEGGSPTWRSYLESDLPLVRIAYRYGPLWWGVGHMDAHDFAQGFYNQLSTRDPRKWPPRIDISLPPRFPGDRPIQDVSYDKSLYERVIKEMKSTSSDIPSSDNVDEGIKLDVDPIEAVAGLPGTGIFVIHVSNTSKRWRIGIPAQTSSSDVKYRIVTTGVVQGPGEAKVSASWPALSPGEYLANVVISTGGGVDNKTSALLQLVVKPSNNLSIPPPDPITNQTPTTDLVLPPLSRLEVRVEELREIVREISLTHPETIIESRIVSIASMSSDILGSPIFWPVIRHYAIGALKLFRRARKSIHNDPRPLP